MERVMFRIVCQLCLFIQFIATTVLKITMLFSDYNVVNSSRPGPDITCYNIIILTISYYN